MLRADLVQREILMFSMFLAGALSRNAERSEARAPSMTGDPTPLALVRSSAEIPKLLNSDMYLTSNQGS